MKVENRKYETFLCKYSFMCTQIYIEVCLRFNTDANP